MNKVTHFEIPADDLNRVQRFYRSVFGWQISKAPMSSAEYYMVNTVATDKRGRPKEAGAINGGMMKRVKKEQTVIVINVPSIDDYLKKVRTAGGRVVLEKQKVGDMGLYARFADTEGNVVGIWQDIKK